jgi:hypothetical protein
MHGQQNIKLISVYLSLLRLLAFCLECNTLKRLSELYSSALLINLKFNQLDHKILKTAIEMLYARFISLILKAPR